MKKTLSLIMSILLIIGTVFAFASCSKDNTLTCGVTIFKNIHLSWANINSDKTVTVATSGDANDSGLFDMTGNILEFCWDWYAFYSDSSTYSPDITIGGPEYGKLRTARGGSWNLYTPFLAAGDRYAFDPSEAYNYIGFRLCRTLPTPQ